MSIHAIPLAVVTLLVMLAVPAAAERQASPPPPQTAPAPPPSGPPTPPPNYAYSPDGRRDPFVSLVNRGVTDGRERTGARPEGAAGLLVNELVVRGIVQSRDGFVAMISGPDGRSYTVRAGDRLMDGRIRAITPDALVILQEVNDPLSLEKQREVRKFLRDRGEEVQ